MEMEIGRQYFRRHVTLLNLAGIKLVGNESFAYRLYSVSALVLLFSYHILGLSVFFENDVRDRFTMIKFEISFVMGGIKGITAFLHRKKLGKILAKLEREPFLPKLERGGDFETEAIREFVSINNLQAKLYWTPSAVYITATLLYTILMRLQSSDHEDWMQPYITLWFTDVSCSPSYEFVIAYQTFAIGLIAIYFTTIDLLIGGILCNVTYQLKMLQNYLKNIDIHFCGFGKVYTSMVINQHLVEESINGNWLQVKNLITSAVEYHLEIITFVNEFERIFSILLLIVFLNTFATLGAMMYETSLISTVGVDLVKISVEVLEAIFQVFMICYWAAQVREESENIGKAAYDVVVAIPNLEFQKAMKLVLLRSQTPITITAGKFVDIDLTTFTWILRMSYSAFMVLRRSQLK